MWLLMELNTPPLPNLASFVKRTFPNEVLMPLFLESGQKIVQIVRKSSNCDAFR